MYLVENTLNRFVAFGQIAGCCASIIRNEETLFEGCFGYANLEKKIKISANTIFPIASMSKVITVAGIMQLYEQGLFKMWDPVSEFLPGFKNPVIAVEKPGGKTELVPAKGEVTMRQLFTMTSGVPYPGEDTAAARIRKQKEEEYLAQGKPAPGTKEYCDMVGQMPLAFEPGEKWMYGFSIDILGGIIEVLSGKTLGEYLKENIFDPLGMGNTGFYVPEEKQERVATLYQIREGMKPSDRRYPARKPEFESGGGGLFSTLEDYSRFAQSPRRNAGGGENIGPEDHRSDFEGSSDAPAAGDAQLGYPARIRIRAGRPGHDESGNRRDQRLRRRMGMGRRLWQLVLRGSEGKPDLRLSDDEPARGSLPLYPQADGVHVRFAGLTGVPSESGE